MRIPALAFILLLPLAAYADVSDCNAALVMSTYNRLETSHTDWRLASLVKESEWNEINQKAGANALIYGVPVGASWSDFQKRVSEKVNSYNESLTHDELINVAWTGLDPNGADAYTKCIRETLLSQEGLQMYVLHATKSEVAIRIRWSPVGNEPRVATPNWTWNAPGKSKLPSQASSGRTTFVLPRPKNQQILNANFQGHDTSLVITPYPPPPTLAPSRPTWHTEDKDGRPYIMYWKYQPNCNGQYGMQSVDATHRCDIERTQIRKPGDNTPYDTWNLYMDAPPGAQVYEVGCTAPGPNEIEAQGIPEGQTGHCKGLINGGASQISMYIKWKQLW